MKSKKKSEMLEVRLSHEDKQALQAKAANEGRTVSFVVRRLISDYLKQPEARSQPTRFTELLMTLKSKPKTVLALAAACILTPLGMASFASAADVSLRINAEYTQPATEHGAEGKRVRRFNTDLHMEADGTATLEIPSQTGSFRLLITSEEVENGLSLKFAILDNGEGWNMSDQLGAFASPSVIVNYDAPIEIEIGHEGGEIFTMKAVPSKLAD